MVRLAIAGDFADILRVYAPFVTCTCVSFEVEVPTIEAFSERLQGIMESYPILVYESDGEIVGYAYASRHREREAYRYSADASVYVAEGWHRRGIGSSLYAELFERLEAMEIFNVYAGIALPNEGSVGLHKRFGFAEVGVYHNAGHKMGKWIDVVWMEKPLKECKKLLK